MIHRTLKLSLGLGLLVHQLSCQEAQSPFSKLFAVHFDSMSRDTFVVRWGRDKTLGDALPEDMLFRLPDSAVVMLAKVLVTSLQQVEPAQCAGFVPGGHGPDLMGLADRVDSATAVKWVAVMHQMMLTGMYDLPRGQIVSRDTVLLEIRAFVDRMPLDERSHVQEVMSAPHPSVADDCFRAQHVFRGLAAMPPRKAGPLFRALMSQGVPH